MIAIIKYNAGNILSVKNTLNRLGCESIVTDDASNILSAERVIFPGVGEASSAMNYLKEKNLVNVITSIKQPFLGICLGLQLMCKFSEEGNTNCLSIYDANVKLFPSVEIVPHMGWNCFETLGGDLFKGNIPSDNVYYVHKYYVEICSYTIATCNYITPFSAALQKDNFYATQFHPEKSSKVGEKILRNFLEL